MKTRAYIQAVKLLGAVVLIGGLMVSAISANGFPAHAAGSYDNSQLADKALAYVGQWGGNACRDAGRAGNGQCKTFVNCIVWMVSGGSQWPAPGYHSGFQGAGGVEVSGASAIKGDIIQVGNSDGDRPLHTAIIVRNLGGGRFNVVDSNFSNNNDELVRQHDYTPPAGARFWRMGTNVTGMPFGHFDEIKRAPGGARINGWAIDPDTTSPIEVHLYGGSGAPGGGNPGKALMASLHREDVGRDHPNYGPNHGYDGSIGLGHGTHQVCAYAINVPSGSNPQLGCKTINISPDPFGYLDEVAPVPGGVEVEGWAIDPDTASPIEVHLYGGSGGPGGGNPGVSLGMAGVSRPDVAQHHEHYGDRHGYKGFFELPEGKHTVCAYGINAPNPPGGHNPQLGCKEVDVPPPADTARPTGTISINGEAARTPSRKVTLALRARDPAPTSGVSLMRFRNANSTWSSWRAYDTRASWWLSRGAGTKEVFVQYKDRAGNFSVAYKDTIKYNP